MGIPYKALYQIIRDAGFTAAYSKFCKRMNGLYRTNNIDKKRNSSKNASHKNMVCQQVIFPALSGS